MKNPEHIETANRIEIRLVEHDLLPAFAPDAGVIIEVEQRMRAIIQPTFKPPRPRPNTRRPAPANHLSRRWSIG
ncbi:hypothetical protein WI73_10150 [Burkholderia ubonensis]|nr:hypothetical protein WI37_09200 [Burkholderia ubonensis]KVC72598.1 hypothetical protein WI73_10150 [Burkholderia ubonensis]